jgi:hypothetical protein
LFQSNLPNVGETQIDWSVCRPMELQFNNGVRVCGDGPAWQTMAGCHSNVRTLWFLIVSPVEPTPKHNASSTVQTDSAADGSESGDGW